MAERCSGWQKSQAKRWWCGYVSATTVSTTPEAARNGSGGWAGSLYRYSPQLGAIAGQRCAVAPRGAMRTGCRPRGDRLAPPLAIELASSQNRRVKSAAPATFRNGLDRAPCSVCEAVRDARSCALPTNPDASPGHVSGPGNCRFVDPAASSATEPWLQFWLQFTRVHGGSGGYRCPGQDAGGPA
jgi:hypothetical protein